MSLGAFYIIMHQ